MFVIQGQKIHVVMNTNNLKTMLTIFDNYNTRKLVHVVVVVVVFKYYLILIIWMHLTYILPNVYPGFQGSKDNDKI